MSRPLPQVTLLTPWPITSMRSAPFVPLIPAARAVPEKASASAANRVNERTRTASRYRRAAASGYDAVLGGTGRQTVQPGDLRRRRNLGGRRGRFAGRGAC